MSELNGLRKEAFGKTGNGVKYAVVDLSVDSTVISATPAVLYGICVNTVLSAHDCILDDDGTSVITLPASTGVGGYDIGAGDVGIRFETNLTVTPNAAATGSIAVFWKDIVE